MKLLERLRPWLSLKFVRLALVLIIIIIIMLIFKGDSASDSSDGFKQISQVSVTTPSEFVGNQSLSLLGNVRAFTEAQVTSERAGRVVSVNVKLGQSVAAGQVLATLENASERASVLQAEGFYDAAVAAAAQSNIGVSEAENLMNSARSNTISTLRAAMNTTNGVVVSNIDEFFANPNSPIPGLRVGGQGYTSILNKERVAYQDLLPEWQNRVNSLTTESDLQSEIEYAKANVKRTIDMIDIFLFIFDKKNDDKYNLSEEEFTNLRTSLNNVVSSLDTTRTQLLSAEDTVERAKLAASGSTASAADAQVKQALGSLRAAQANLAKTILRTPVSGTVNSLSIRAGDFINSFSTVAVVANNNALEIITYVSDSERNHINEGDVVIIEGEFEGRVTQIAPAVDSATRKTEVRIATEGIDISNGDTVRVTKNVSTVETVEDTVRVPLTAVKFEQEDGYIFQVIDGKLVDKSVELGPVLGNSVEIASGLSVTDEFVVDVRGLVKGESVEISK